MNRLGHLGISGLGLVFFMSLAHAAPKSKVYFISPKDGATVTSPVAVKFGVKGMKIEPAGPLKPGSGHHHLIVDGAPVDKGQVVTKDETHIHYGKGQTEDQIKLSPGPHKLTLQFADGAHISYGPEMSATISIAVK